MYKLFMKLYGRRLAEQCYTGILGRTGDQAGIESYARELARNGRLDKVLADMAGSDEAWQRNWRARSEALAKVAYLAALDREPSPEELADATARLGSGPAGLGELFASLAAGRKRQGWRADDAGDLVGAVFAGLLGRSPDEAALQGYGDFLVNSQDAAATIADVAASDEHWSHLVARRAPALVHLVFRALLQRDADEAALASYAAQLAETRDLQALIDEVGSSREHRNLLLRRVAAAARATNA